MFATLRLRLLVGLIGTLLCASVGAYNWFFPIFIKHGEVVARGLVKGPSGAPIFVIYGETGEVVSEIGEATGDLANAFVISGSTYQAYVDQMNDILSEQQPVHKGARVMTRDDYNAATFKTIDEKYELTKPDLAPSVVSVIVRGQQTLLQRDDNPLIMQSPINLFNVAPLGGDIKSILFNQQGDVVQKSALNIGYKAEFYEEPGPRRKPISPIQGIFVEGPNAAIGGISGDLTNQKGQYTFTVIYPPCPGFSFDYTTPVFAHLYYRNFNPRGQRYGTYHIMKPGYDTCVGYSAFPPGLTLGGLMAQIDAMAIEATMAIPLDNTKFQIDVMMLTGEARVAHGVKPVEVGGATEYKYEQPDTSPVIHQEGADEQGNPLLGYDFDGDGKPDKAVRGKLQLNQQTNKEEFVADAEGTLQGIYLSSGDRKPDATEPEKRQPDFTRLMDKQSDFSHQGLLSRISVDDLKKTDLYVFRESNGMLITERRGLKADEAIFNTGDYNERDNKIYYKVLIRGPREGNMMRLDFEGWQTRSKMNPALQVRQADHLRPGENVRLVLINRATGYIGTMTTQLKGADNTPGNTISFPISEIYMNPPNLSVRAVRRTTIEQGLTKGEERDYLIGFEGGATSHDNVIEVFTEWYDADGRPLPEELGEFGYTGRLAKIVGENQLAADGGEIANFTIKPGKHRQLIRIKDDAITKEHYYIHINGEVKDRNPDFSTLGAGAGPLQSRPAHYTPFKVPVFDEKATIEARLAWKKARDEGQVTGRFPLPVYRFVYRPEMQFSLFDLQMQNIRHGRDGQDGVDILNAQTPGVSNIDDFVRLSYNLMANDLAPLPLLGAEREMIFAVGEQELAATMGSDRQLHFRNLNHLASLAPEDFLTMRLYFNHDPENVLWQFAFGAVSLLPEKNKRLNEQDNTIEVSADHASEGPLAINAFIAGKTKPNNESQRMVWRVEGNANLDNTVTENSEGIHAVSLTLPTVSQQSVAVMTRFDTEENGFFTPIFKIIPGVPYRIDVQQEGKTVVGGLGEIKLKIKVWDKFNNLVQDGTKVNVELAGVKIEGSALTVNGEASLSLIGDDESGSFEAIVSAGYVKKNVPVTVHDIQLSFTDIADVTLQSNRLIEISATSDYGSLAGAQLDLAVHRGRLLQHKVALNEQGRATVVYSSGEFPGMAQVSARVSGTSRAVTEKFFVRNTGDYLLSNVLVTDGDGEIDVGGGSHQYGRNTQLVVYSQPNTSVTSKLNNIFEPPVYALLDYALFTPDGNDLRLRDISSGIDAIAHSANSTIANHPNFSVAIDLIRGGAITLPEHSRTNGLTQAGINFWIKIPDLSDGANETLVDWDNLGLTLARTAGNQLELIAVSNGQSFQVQSSGSLVAGKWHQVAVHYFGGKVHLGLDGVVSTTDISGTLEVANQHSYSLQMKATAHMQVADLKVFDWLGESKLLFENGTFESTAMTDASGVARLSVQSRPAVIAYTRFYRTPVNSFPGRLSNLFVSTAYADGVSEQQCLSSFQPIPPDAPDALIAEAEQFMDIILECYIKTRVERARIEYQTADGLRSKAVALMKEGVYVATYETLKAQKRSALMFLNCLDAAVTGENSSATGALCDFVTGLLAIGDIRDLLIQGWHYHFGDRNKYDPLVASLATVGLIADGVQLIPGAQGAAVVNALTASAKQMAKILRLIGDTGRLAGKTVGNHLGAIVNDDTLSMAMKLEKLKKILPLLEIGASVALIYQSEPKIFKFLAAALTSGQTLDNIVNWLERYLQRLGSEAGIASYQKVPAWVDALFPAAHADVSNAVKDLFIRQLRELLAHGPKVSGQVDEILAAKQFNTALDYFLKNISNGTYTLRNVPNDMHVLRAFMKFNELIGESAAKRLAYNGGWTIGLNAIFTDKHMIKAFAELDVEKLLRGGIESGQAGFARVASQLEMQFKFSKGHMSHLLIITDLLKRTDIKLKGIEITEVKRPAAGNPRTLLPERRIDVVVEQAGQEIKVELKNFQHDTWKNNLGKMMKDEVPDAGQEAATEVVAGQLVTDLVKYIEGGFKGRQIWFTPDVIPGARQLESLPDAATIAAKEVEIAKHVYSLFDSNKVKIAERYFNLKIAGPGVRMADVERWDEIMLQLKSSLDSSNQNFVKIYSFSNIVPPRT